MQDAVEQFSKLFCNSGNSKNIYYFALCTFTLVAKAENFKRL